MLTQCKFYSRIYILASIANPMKHVLGIVIIYIKKMIVGFVSKSIVVKLRNINPNIFESIL